MAEELTPYEQSVINPLSVRDEVYKLLLIVADSKEPIYPSYIEEKLGRILKGVPITLHPHLAHEYDEWVKRGRR